MDIFKVNILNSNREILKIIVFSGDNNSNDIFSNIEKENIQNENIEVVYSKQQIHIDDSIRIIKTKILREIDVNKYSYDELCMFGNMKHTPNMYNLYNLLTQNEKNAFTSQTMAQLMINLNIDDSVINQINKKNKYLYEDLLQLQNIQNEYLLSISLGRKFAKYRDYLYSANPFGLITEQAIYPSALQNELITFENTLLLNYGKLVDNNIYLCLADDVFDYAIKNGYNEENMSEMYFPLLFQNNIMTKDDLQKQKQVLIKKSKMNIDEERFKLYEMVSMYYNIFQGKNRDLPYDERGIYSFEILFKTGLNSGIPLEIIFKNIHSSKTIPLMKFNPGNLRENLYRLYSEKISRNGKKIPYLNENTINQLSKKIGKGRQISLFVQNEYNVGEITKKIDIYIDLEQNGNIRVYGDLKQAVLQEELNNIIELSLNPVIQNINGFLQQSGYTIQLFTNINHEDVEVVNMKYRSKIQIKKDIVLKKYTNCLSSIFNIIDSDVNTGAHLIFKRVDNYKEMNEKMVLIKRVYDETQNLASIINALIQTYKMSEEDAKKMAIDYFSEITEIRGKIIENPGFPVLIKMEPLENRLLIEIDNITSIDYLFILHMYIDSFLRITQDPSSTNVPLDVINNSCLKVKALKKDVDKSHINNALTTNIGVSFLPQLKTSEEDLKENIEEDDDNALFYEDEEDQVDYDEILQENIGEEEPAVEEPAGGEEESAVEEITENVAKDIVNSIENIRDKTIEKLESIPSDSSSPGGIFYSDESSSNNGSQDGGMSEINFQGFFDDDSLVSNDTKIDGEKLNNMKLSNPNIFEERIKKRDPKLFFTKDGNYSAYSRSCESNIRRQPVILTNEEKRNIDENHPGSYNHAIHYGSDPNNKFWYICPRYWCLLTNTSMTEEEVKSGVCGKVIPRGEEGKTVPPGHYVYEFNHPEEHQRKDGTYIDHYPGFLDKKKHSDGYCLPCCFTKWDSEYMRKRRQVCSQDETPSNVDKGQLQSQKPGNYVMGIDKYPLDKNRWGFLPFSVQSFLQTNNSECVSKNNPALIRPNTSCLLRYGVDKSKTQSFLSCIADAYAYIQKIQEVPSLKEIKTILANSISLDNFLQYHNGSLVSVFRPKILVDEIDVDKYSDSEFMKSIDTNNPVQYDFLEITIASYERFIEYIKSEDSIIDHTYLWDCITQPNSKIMKEGINLVIMELSNRDITDNMEILCPTNSQSSLLYDSRKKTLILLKHNEYYEPIYLYNEEPNLIIKTFDEHNSPKNIKKILTIIQKSTQKYCSSRPSMPSVYEFKKNIPVKELSNILKKEKYYIESQIINYQNKVIGLIVKQNSESKTHVFIPCLPSSILTNIERKYMEDNELWNDYKTTVKELTNIHSATEGKIRCKPMMKIIEDGLIVGILTETNQFVQINTPIENTIDDGLIPLNETNYTLADNIITNTNKVDNERVETVKKIKLESQFYDIFRSMVRNLLNDYIHRNVRKQILELIENRSLIHKEKIRKMEEILQDLTKHKIMFSEIDSNILMKLDNIYSCSSDCLDEGSTQKIYCLKTNANECQFIIPKNHLVSGLSNEKVYFSRVADELLRYKRVQLFMLYPKTYLNIGNSDYKINSDELILLQSLLVSEYFKDMDPFNINKYIQNVDYNTAIPAVSQKYPNDPISLKDQLLETTTTDENINECINVIRDVVGNPTTSLWKRIFLNKKFNEIVFNNSPQCSYQVILHILQDKLKKLITIENLKISLWNAYSKYYDKYKQKILIILKKQGKGKILDSVIKNKVSFEDLLFSDSYYLTDLDIWMIADKFNLPIILFSSTKLGGLVDSIDWLMLGTELSKPFYFIRSPQNIRSNTKTGYQLISPPVVLSDVNEFHSIVQNKLRENTKNPQENLQSMANYLERYVYIKK